LFGVQPDFVQTSSEDLLIIKHKDQKFRQLHEVQTIKTQNNNNNTHWIYFVNLSSKGYIDLETKVLFSIFLLPCVIHISLKLFFYCFYKVIFDHGKDKYFFFSIFS